MSKLCQLCNWEVHTDEPSGWCYIIEEDESLVYLHQECLEVYWGVGILG